MIPLLVPEIEGGPLSVTEEEKEQKKDWVVLEYSSMYRVFF